MIKQMSVHLTDTFYILCMFCGCMPITPRGLGNMGKWHLFQGDRGKRAKL